jgi:hypothetical protein
MRAAKEVEGFRLFVAAFAAVLRHESAELDQPGLFRGAAPARIWTAAALKTQETYPRLLCVGNRRRSRQRA